MKREKKTKTSGLRIGTITMRDFDLDLWAKITPAAKACGWTRQRFLELAIRGQLQKGCS